MANNLIVCGGTFDHFHKGHESLLKLAFSLGKRVVIGITSNIYVQNSKFKIQNSKLIEDYKIRKNSLEEFLAQKKIQDRASVLEIDDLFGPTLSRDFLVDGIAVSDDTKKGAEIINQKRKELDLKPLEVFVASSIRAEDGKLISSERIRNGEINRKGRLYINPLWLKKDLTLPENLRERFHKPFGKLLIDFKSLFDNKNSLIITVGDVTTKKLNQLAVNQQVSVIDFKVARKETFSLLSDLGFRGNEEAVTAENPAGHITHDLFSKVIAIFKSGFNQRMILKITGEEDLAVLPLILVAPLGTIIYYGQPNKGLVKVLVSEDSKEQIYNLILKFKPI